MPDVIMGMRKLSDWIHYLPVNVIVPERKIPSFPRTVPGDSFSYVANGLTGALRQFHPNVDEYVLPHDPAAQDIADLLLSLKKSHVIILGTNNAFASQGQIELVRQMLGLKIPTIIVALRLPYDLACFPEAPVYICTYSILEPSMRALAETLFGEINFRGRLPVSIPDCVK